jgi:MFS family permease
LEEVFSPVWVILGYMLAQTSLVLMVGRFAGMIGRKKLYVAGFALFTVVSLISRLPHPAGERAIGLRTPIQHRRRA